MKHIVESGRVLKLNRKGTVRILLRVADPAQHMCIGK
jgi:hypothetical protein